MFNFPALFNRELKPTEAQALLVALDTRYRPEAQRIGQVRHSRRC
jgi:hypothetical protein